MRAVLDCNVYLSGLIRSGGPPALILAAMWRQEFELVLSPAIFAEYQRAAKYPNIRKRISLSDRELQELEQDILVLSFWIEPEPAALALVPADPSDDAYLLASAESRTDYLVSGDRHLLDLGRHQGIPIVSPRDFLKALA